MKKKLGDDLAALIKKLAIKYNVMESIIRQKLDDNDKQGLKDLGLTNSGKYFENEIEIDDLFALA